MIEDDKLLELNLPLEQGQKISITAIDYIKMLTINDQVPQKVSLFELFKMNIH